MVKLMPLPSVHLIVLSLLAACGGLLSFHLRRLGAGLFLPAAAVPSPGGFCARLQAPDAASGGPAARGRSASNTPFTPRAQGELILVVDDEESVLELLSTVLRNHGYQVALARDGVEGLALFSAQPDRIALVLTDLHLPNSSGQSFADLLRPLRPDVRILFMSGMDTGEGALESGDARSSDPFLLKPFKPAVLLETIHRLLH
jgi:CheY-like chemotaxis protein